MYRDIHHLYTTRKSLHSIVVVETIALVLVVVQFLSCITFIYEKAFANIVNN